jgi:hypothetical protein
VTRARFVAVALAAALAASLPASAAVPMTLLLGKTQGRGSVTIGAPTTHLHGRIWLYRLAGAGIASGDAEVSCTGSSTSRFATGSDQWFRFTLRPNHRQELWRFTGDRCTITATLAGKGLLRVELRGY